MKTILSKEIINDIEEYIYDYHHSLKNLGQTDDSEQIKTIHYNYELFDNDNLLIGFRICSPSHFGDEACIYWFVVNN